MNQQLITVIPNSMVDDFFFFGFLGGIISYAYYLFTSRNDKEHLNGLAGLYGTFLSGCVGGLLAVVFDRAIELSILIGLLNQFIYMALLKSAKSGKFFEVLKDILLKYLTAGKA